MKYYLLISALFFSVTSFATDVHKEKVLNFNYSNFSAAHKSESYFRFVMSSSLLGFITTDFSGYAKVFQLKWEENKKNIKNLKIIIPIEFMDTDKESRTTEMQEDCFEMKSYKNIIVSINGPISLTQGTKSIEAIAQIRGLNSKLKFDVTLDKVLDQWQISGQLPVKISEININNPTIARGLASFDENVKILFNFIIK